MTTCETSHSRWHGDNVRSCNAASRASASLCTSCCHHQPVGARAHHCAQHTRGAFFLWLLHSSMRVPTKLISSGCQSSFNELERCRARVAMTGQGSCVPESRMRALCIETQVSRASPEALRVTGRMRATNVVLARYRGGACKPLPDECCLPYQALACSEQQQNMQALRAITLAPPHTSLHHHHHQHHHHHCYHGSLIHRPPLHSQQQDRKRTEQACLPPGRTLSQLEYEYTQCFKSKWFWQDCSGPMREFAHCAEALSQRPAG
jgi:hypothetical protein